jgi:hypothetical protein
MCIHCCFVWQYSMVTYDVKVYQENLGDIPLNSSTKPHLYSCLKLGTDVLSAYSEVMFFALEKNIGGVVVSEIDHWFENFSSFRIIWAHVRLLVGLLFIFHSLVICGVFCRFLSFCPSFFAHCITSTSAIYGLWLALWWCQTLRYV